MDRSGNPLSAEAADPGRFPDYKRIIPEECSRHEKKPVPALETLHKIPKGKLHLVRVFARYFDYELLAKTFAGGVEGWHFCGESSHERDPALFKHEDGRQAVVMPTRN